MRILIVEDEEHIAAELSERITNLDPIVETVIARSRSSATDALHRAEFDFIICDLRLPPEDGGVDTDEAHGLAVHSEAKDICPGTPCLFFTGFATEKNVRDQLSGGGTADILGTGQQYGMTQLLTKDEFRSCIERVDLFNRELETLAGIVIDLPDNDLKLDEIEERALRVLARPLGGTGIDASPMGGRSGARTLRARVRDNQGRVLALYFAKIASRLKMDVERQNYEQYVSPLLGIGTYPALGRDINAGIGKREALFYQLADPNTISLFDLLDVDEPSAVRAIDSLQGLLAPWSALRDVEHVRIADLRTERIDDLAFEPFRERLGAIDTFESSECELTTSCQHGDLHGLNVLYDAAGNVLVIDFGNVGPAPACLDPVLLELSVLFHIDSPFRSSLWPTVTQAEAWFDLDAYLVGCPIPEFIRACREWALRAGGPSTLPPVVYVEAVRQLKYPDTNRERAIAIGGAAVRAAA